MCSQWRSLSWDNTTSQCVLSAWTGRNSRHPFKHSRDTREAATPPHSFSLQPESIYHQADGFSINKDCCPCNQRKGVRGLFSPLWCFLTFSYSPSSLSAIAANQPFEYCVGFTCAARAALTHQDVDSTSVCVCCLQQFFSDWHVSNRHPRPKFFQQKNCTLMRLSGFYSFQNPENLRSISNARSRVSVYASYTEIKAHCTRQSCITQIGWDGALDPARAAFHSQISVIVWYEWQMPLT